MTLTCVLTSSLIELKTIGNHNLLVYSHNEQATENFLINLVVQKSVLFRENEMLTAQDIEINVAKIYSPTGHDAVNLTKKNAFFVFQVL